MKDLQISHKSSISNAGVANISGLTSLKRLSIGGERFTDAGLIHLANLDQLNSLWIKGSLTDKGLKQIEKMKSLQVLDITTGKKISKKSIKHLYNTLPNIRQFNVKEGVVAGWKGPGKKKHLRVGQVAPPFKLTSLNDKELSIENHRGKVLLLYFWSTSCKPCVASVPKLKEAYKELSKYEDFAMISLSADNNDYIWRQFVKKQKLHWPQVRIGDNSKTAAAYGVAGFPKYFLIGRDGKILHVGAGKGFNTALLKALEGKEQKSN